MENKLKELLHIPRRRLRHRSRIACGDCIKSKDGLKDKNRSIPPPNVEKLKEKKAAQFAIQVTNRFTELEAAQDVVIPQNMVLLEVVRYTIGSVKLKKMDIWWHFRNNQKKEKQKAKIRINIKNRRLRYKESSQWINSSIWKACVCGTESSKCKIKFQAALSDSQINDSKVSATSAMYSVSDWRKSDWSCTKIADR